MPTITMEESDDKLLLGILLEARIEDVESVVKLLAKSHVTAPDLIAEPEGRAEVMLQQAGVPVGDCYKIMREIKRLNSPMARGGGGCTGWLSRLAMGCCFPCCRRAFAGRATMKCGLVVYSTTVVLITFTLFSFYLPAILYQSRPSNRRISGHFLDQTQAPHAGRIQPACCCVLHSITSCSEQGTFERSRLLLHTPSSDRRRRTIRCRCPSRTCLGGADSPRRLRKGGRYVCAPCTEREKQIVLAAWR